LLRSGQTQFGLLLGWYLLSPSLMSSGALQPGPESGLVLLGCSNFYLLSCFHDLSLTCLDNCNHLIVVVIVVDVTADLVLFTFFIHFFPISAVCVHFPPPFFPPSCPHLFLTLTLTPPGNSLLLTKQAKCFLALAGLFFRSSWRDFCGHFDLKCLPGSACGNII
jgi:hypothetical protein